MRENKGWTQGQLATYARIGGSTVSLIESGERLNPGADILKKIARALGTTTDYLVGLTDDPSPPPPDWTALPPALRPLVRRLASLPPTMQARVAEAFTDILGALERTWKVSKKTMGEKPKYREPTLKEEIAEVVAEYPDLGPLFERARAGLPEHAVRALLLNVRIWVEEAEGETNGEQVSFRELHAQLNTLLNRQ